MLQLERKPGSSGEELGGNAAGWAAAPAVSEWARVTLAASARPLLCAAVTGAGLGAHGTLRPGPGLCSAHGAGWRQICTRCHTAPSEPRMSSCLQAKSAVYPRYHVAVPLLSSRGWGWGRAVTGADSHSGPDISTGSLEGCTQEAPREDAVRHINDRPQTVPPAGLCWTARPGGSGRPLPGVPRARDADGSWVLGGHVGGSGGRCRVQACGWRRQWHESARALARPLSWRRAGVAGGIHPGAAFRASHRQCTHRRVVRSQERAAGAPAGSSGTEGPALLADGGGSMGTPAWRGLSDPQRWG